MCVRYSNAISNDDVLTHFGVKGVPPYYPPRFNIAPAEHAPIVRLDSEGQRRLALYRWGFVPASGEDPDRRFALIHARGEALTSSPVFQDAFRYRRCLVPADGFYQWRLVGKSKVPYYFRMRDFRPFAFAGLWERWESEEHGDVILSFAIVVTTATHAKPIPSRSPVILPPSRYEAWLSNDTTSDLLEPYTDDDLVHYLVSPRTMTPGVDEPSLVQPLEMQSS